MIPTLTPLVLHEDAFYAFFVPYRHPKSRHNIWGGLGLETFGEDYALARSLNPNHIWTVLDGDSSSDQWIIPGIHYVNRVCYLVTRRAHFHLCVEFRIPHTLRSLTPLGLKRQLLKLERTISAQTQAIIVPA